MSGSRDDDHVDGWGKAAKPLAGQPAHDGSGGGHAKPANGLLDYEVGYGKPPPHSQFKKGESGNPSGKSKAAAAGLQPKRRQNFDQMVAGILDQKRRLPDGKRITNRELLANRFVKDIAEGRTKQWPAIINYIQRFDQKTAASPRPQDLERFEHLVNRIIDRESKKDSEDE